MAGKAALSAGIGVTLAVLVKALLRIALLIGGAYALTTYTTLPGLVDGLIWLAASGYSLLIVIGLFTVASALIAAASTPKRRF